MLFYNAEKSHEIQLQEAYERGYEAGYKRGLKDAKSDEEQAFKELIKISQELKLYDIDTAEIVRDIRNHDNTIDNLDE